MLMQFLSPDTEFWEIPVFEVNNQHILVTAVQAGLDATLRFFLASNGAKVTLAARRADALASVVAHSTNPTATAIFFPLAQSSLPSAA
jgi:NADP-dependent 3-hydroxy acid dehydrogenase YdfG